MNINIKYIIYIILLLIILYILINNQENADSVSGATSMSNEALQNIASVFNNQRLTVSNLTTTGTLTASDITTNGNIRTTGNIIGNLSVSNINANPESESIVLNSPITYAEKLKPFILTIGIGNYKGPIYDASGNTFPINKYTIKQIQGQNIIGIRNGKWWICPYPNWDTWYHSVLEITPLPLSNFYSSYTTHGSITNDGGFNGSTGWAMSPINSSNNSYYVYDVSGTAKQISIQPSPSS